MYRDVIKFYQSCFMFMLSSNIKIATNANGFSFRFEHLGRKIATNAGVFIFQLEYAVIFSMEDTILVLNFDCQFLLHD